MKMREGLAIFTKNIPSFSFGIGYAIFLSEKISITPLITYKSYPPFMIDNYYQDIGSTMSSSQSTSHALNFSFKLSYTIKPTIPLCPIRSCSVSLYHKHNNIGNKVVRGTILSKPQNTQVAEKYKRVRRRRRINQTK